MVKIDMKMPKSCYTCPFRYSEFMDSQYFGDSIYQLDHTCLVPKGPIDIVWYSEKESDGRHPRCPLEEDIESNSK